jgi:hypothetical protein
LRFVFYPDQTATGPKPVQYVKLCQLLIDDTPVGGLEFVDMASGAGLYRAVPGTVPFTEAAFAIGNAVYGTAEILVKFGALNKIPSIPLIAAYDELRT